MEWREQYYWISKAWKEQVDILQKALLRLSTSLQIIHFLRSTTIHVMVDSLGNF